MRHLESHVAFNVHDVELAVLSGLVGQSIRDGGVCANDGREVGERLSGFVPFVIVLDDETEFLLCVECAQPILKPGW